MASDRPTRDEFSYRRAKRFGRNWGVIDEPSSPWVYWVSVELVDGAPQIVALMLLPRSDDGRSDEDRILKSDRLRAVSLNWLREVELSHRQVLKTEPKVYGWYPERGESPSSDQIEWAATIEDAERTRRDPAHRKPAQHGDDHYREVAEVYRKALVAPGASPRRAIADRFCVGLDSASKYIKEARRRGHLGWPSRTGVAGIEAATSPVKKGRK